MPRKNDAAAMNLPPKPRSEKEHEAERNLPRVIVQEEPKARPPSKPRSEKAHRAETSLPRVIIREEPKPAALALERAQKEDEEAKHKTRSVREAINALYDDNVLPRVEPKKTISPEKFEKSFNIPEAETPTQRTVREATAAFTGHAAERDAKAAAAKHIQEGKAHFQKQIENTKQSLGQEKAARIWDRAYELTNKKDGDAATRYVFEFAKLYTDAQNREPAELEKEIQQLNKKYNVPETYNPISEGGAMRLTATRAIGETRGRGQMESRTERTTGSAARVETPVQKEPQRRKAYETLKAEPAPAPKAEESKETISARQLEAWRGQLIKENDDWHAELARLMAENRNDANQQRIWDVTRKIKETEGELGKIARYEGLGSDQIAEALVEETKVGDLSKRMDQLSRQIKKAYGRTPEELLSLGGFSLNKARVQNWLRRISGQGAHLSEWEKLNDEYKKTSDVLESYRARYKKSSGEKEVARIPSQKEVEREASLSDLMTEPTIGVAGMAETDYEKRIGLGPVEQPKAEEPKPEQTASRSIRGFNIPELYDLVMKQTNGNEKTTTAFINAADNFLYAAKEGIQTDMDEFEKMVTHMGIQKDPNVMELIRTGRREFAAEGHIRKSEAPKKIAKKIEAPVDRVHENLKDVTKRLGEIEDRWITGKNPPSASDYLTAQNAVSGLIENIEAAAAGTKLDARVEELIASLRETEAGYEALANELIRAKQKPAQKTEPTEIPPVVVGDENATEVPKAEKKPKTPRKEKKEESMPQNVQAELNNILEGNKTEEDKKETLDFLQKLDTYLKLRALGNDASKTPFAKEYAASYKNWTDTDFAALRTELQKTFPLQPKSQPRRNSRAA